eukprot:TRINITY_DN6873_c1_g1_i1.p1 TRINITY_DN6873_c1_g1~~TRINITY_DN6873_c1_g1_i1.p1  ORF type:complete len:789 (-),score=206.33 TRINITY_DN6873_c1_g1_i1:238-2604(-)
MASAAVEGPSTFRQLLTGLEVEHERALRKLRLENEQLREQLQHGPCSSGGLTEEAAAQVLKAECEGIQWGKKRPSSNLAGSSGDYEGPLSHEDTEENLTIVPFRDSALAKVLEEKTNGLHPAVLKSADDSAGKKDETGVIFQSRASDMSSRGCVLAGFKEVDIKAEVVVNEDLSEDGEDDGDLGSTGTRGYGLKPLLAMVGSYRMKECWAKEINDSWKDSLKAFVTPDQMSSRKRFSFDQNQEVKMTGGPANCLKRSWVIHPNGEFRVSWDVVGMFLIGYDVLAIPYNQAFMPDPNLFMQIMDGFALGFWTLDMLQAFNVGFYSEGQYITDRRRILIRYLLTWFIIDLVVVGPEWLTLVAGSGDFLGGMGRMLKSVRAVRIVRLVRLLKLQRIINMLYDLIESEYMFICVNLGKLLVSVLLLNHVIACLWFWVGRVCMENKLRNWIYEGEVHDGNIMWKYTTSLHWSLTQFTPASMDISARNEYERMFSIIVLFFAMVAFSSIIGSITGSMTSLRNMKNEEMKQFWFLRRYLRQRHVSSDLSVRIIKYLEHVSNSKKALVQVTSIKILSSLSEALTNELKHQLHAKAILSHPFIHYINNEMEAVMHRLCRHALQQQAYAECEVVFNSGEEAKSAFIVKAGRLRYNDMDGNQLEPEPMENEWFGEPCLWVIWRHVGDLASETDSEMLLMTVGPFAEVMGRHPRSFYFAREYARQFLGYLNKLSAEQLSDVLRNEQLHHELVNEAIHAERSGQSGQFDPNCLKGAAGLSAVHGLNNDNSAASTTIPEEKD